MNELHIDIVFPFCPRHCDYCDALTHTGRVSDFERYANALERELRAVAADTQGRTVTSVRFSGGSPVLLPSRSTARILETLRSAYDVAPDADIALEATCAGLSFDALGRYREAGIRFLELGQETFDGPQHDALGLCYPMNSFIDARKLLGFCKWDAYGMSLLYGLPGQNAVNLATSVTNAVDFGCQEISLAPLRLRPGSALKDKYGSDPSRFAASPRRAWPTDDDRRVLRTAAIAQLEKRGYARLTQHLLSRNSTLRASQRARCDDIDRLGVGVGAWSRLGDGLYRTTTKLARYIEHADDPSATVDAVAHLSSESASRRFAAARLFSCEGISAADHERRFGTPLPREVIERLCNLEERAWAVYDSGRRRWTLTDEGGFHYEKVVNMLSEEDA